MRVNNNQTYQKSIFKRHRFLGRKVFTNHLSIPKPMCKVTIIDFGVCLTSLMFHFTSSQPHRVFVKKNSEIKNAYLR